MVETNADAYDAERNAEIVQIQNEARQRAALKRPVLPGTSSFGQQLQGVDPNSLLADQLTAYHNQEVERQSKKGLPPWLRERLERGNAFNTIHAFDYPYREVAIESPSGRRYRVDAYDPGVEIVSRKLTYFSDIKEQTGIGYIQEAVRKYSPGSAIVSEGPLKGSPLTGRIIVEVPYQVRPVPQSVLNEARRKGVTIRDVYGNVYK
ncbi:hypothetical protein L0222_32490 [bacterium]|nr:hypothetical protein [bacterium]